MALLSQEVQEEEEEEEAPVGYSHTLLQTTVCPNCSMELKPLFELQIMCIPLDSEALDCFHFSRAQVWRQS